MSKPETTPPDLGRIAYEKHWEFTNFEHPRLGMRTATWEELGTKLQDGWREVAKAVVDAAMNELEMRNG